MKGAHTNDQVAPMRLLLIEDEPQMILALHRMLAPFYQVAATQTGKGGIRAALSQSFDAIILDLHLPDMSGLRVCEHLRSVGGRVPILVVSGETAIESKVSLLDSGADDYITKPFNSEELLARLRALIRLRSTGRPAPARIVIDDLVLDTLKHTATRAGVELALTRKEFAVLECLMSSPNMVLSRQELARRVWGEDWIGTANTIDVHIKYLRDKVDRPFAPQLIRTVRGIGYKLDASNVAVT